MGTSIEQQLHYSIGMTGARAGRESDAIRDTNSPLIELIARTLARGIRSRVFRPGVDPVELYISVAGLRR